MLVTTLFIIAISLLTFNSYSFMTGALEFFRIRSEGLSFRDFLLTILIATNSLLIKSLASLLSVLTFANFS